MSLKRCDKCGQLKPVAEMGKDRSRPGGLRPTCNACLAKRAREWRKLNPQYRRYASNWRRRHPLRYSRSAAKSRKKNAAKIRCYALRRSFGITLVHYNQLLSKQEGRCAVCRRLPEELKANRSLAVDHCHTTGTVRGLLCYSCNMVIGLSQDRAAVLLNAAEYLLQYETYE